MKSLILRFAASRFVILLQRHSQDWFHNSLKCIFSSKDFNCAKLEIRKMLLSWWQMNNAKEISGFWIFHQRNSQFSQFSQVPDTNTNQSIKYQSESARPYPPYISCEENSLYSLTLSKSLKPYFSVPVKKTVLLSVSYVGLTRADSWKHDVGNRSSVK